MAALKATLRELQKAGIFAGIVLVPVALALALLQPVNLMAPLICLLGFGIYALGLWTFGQIVLDVRSAQFVRAGRFVCGLAYLIATLCATMLLLEGIAQERFTDQLTHELAKNFDGVAHSNPAELIEIPLNAAPAALDGRPYTGIARDNALKLASLHTITKPFIKTVVQGVGDSVELIFYVSLLIAFLSIVFAVFLRPLLGGNANGPGTSA
jgi:hypothetical protein